MKKTVSFDFSAIDGGINAVDDPLLFPKDVNGNVDMVQVGTMNHVLTPFGAIRRPAQVGIAGGALIGSRLTGFGIGVAEDGTELAYTTAYNSASVEISPKGRIYKITKSPGAASMVLSGSSFPFYLGDGTMFFKWYRNKTWICGAMPVKVEQGDHAYRVGIAAPAVSGTSAAAGSGGSLATGTYKIIIGYYRKVSGTIVLYSVGRAVTDITLDSGHRTIQVGVPRPLLDANGSSWDQQVSGVVVWMTDADGSVYYSYYNYDTDFSAGDAVFSITSDAQKNAALVYEVQAVNNITPANFTHIEFHDNRMWGIDPTTKHRVWYSLKAGTDYDLEKFPALNYIDFPFEVTGLVSIGQHIYANTKGGMIRQPYGDPTVKFEYATADKFYFAFMGTVGPWKGAVIGLTSDGVRYFDGEQWSADLSAKIKPIIDAIYSSTAPHLPCGVVVRRNLRTEYHLSYMDTAIGTTNNNRRLVMNLDKITAETLTYSKTAWEQWDSGAEFFAVDATNHLYSAQTIATAGQICLDTFSVNGVGCTADLYNYSNAGVMQTTARRIPLTLITAIKMKSMTAKCRFYRARMMAQLLQDVAVSLILRDNNNRTYTKTITAGGTNRVAKFDEATWDDYQFQGDEAPQPYRWNLPMNLTGYTAYLKVTQTADDPNYKIISLGVEAQAVSGRMA